MFDIKSISIPKSPGVYLMKGSEGEIIYVGKAKNLRSRVSSYFVKNQISPKTEMLMRKIADIEFILTDTETEALLLENRLIKKNQPKYNIWLKDAKQYAYIKITDEKFPRIISTRRVTKKGEYFGPYTDGYARLQIVRLCQSLFKLRTCKTLPKRVCLQYHIKRCSGPCEGHINRDDYMESVNRARMVLKGNTKSLKRELEGEMIVASETRRYELARERRDQIRALDLLEEKQKVDLQKSHDQDVIALLDDDNHIQIGVFHIKKGVIAAKEEFRIPNEGDVASEFIRAYYRESRIPKEIIINRVPDDKTAIEEWLTKDLGMKVEVTIPRRGEKKRLLELVEKNTRASMGEENPLLQELQEDLNLPTLPKVIECFDMSNIQDAHRVGAMVQFVNGKPSKSGYRRFIIKTVDGQDDFASMRECVLRRYKRLVEEGSPLPDLIIADGGKGQLSAVLDSLRELNLRIPSIGLAKKEEEIFIPGWPGPLILNRKKKSLHLLQRIRDSVHHFAITFHRIRRKKEMTKSILDDIPGIGEAKRQALLAKFGTIKKMVATSEEELAAIIGKSAAKALKNTLADSSPQ